MATISQQEFLKGGKKVQLVVPASDNFGLPKQEKPGFFSRVSEDLKKRGSSIAQTFKDTASGKINPLETGIQTVGAVAGGVNDIIGEGVKSAVNAMPEGIKEPLKQGAIYILQTKAGQAGLSAIGQGIEKYNQWKAENPQLAKDLESVVNIAALLPVGKGGQIAKEGLESGGKKAVELGAKAVDAVSDSKAVAFAGEVGQKIGGSISSIPRRVGANIEANQAQRAVINTLPTKTAKLAAKDGISPNDIKFIYSIPKQEKLALKKLFNITEKFADDTTKANPIQAVGNSVTKRIKELESVRSSIGSKLGEIANKLGNVAKDELVSPVFENLKKVNGLSGLKIGKSGKLNFSNTSLATELSKADRSAIQKAFNSAIKAGTGKQKHLLRQELFEILGGKKRSLQQLTETQEKAFEAIRKGLSDVLESKNSNYKALSNSYRQTIQPLQDIRKFMKNVVGANEDILDMQAGLLARRLTSNATSNPQIRSILKQMDAVLKSNGKRVPISTERLQDFYNVLDKYFDIAGKTSFQGQVQRGLEKAGGVREMAVEAARSLAGKTDEVTKKALKMVIEEALK